jgi:hypothetical protein
MMSVCLYHLRTSEQMNKYLLNLVCMRDIGKINSGELTTKQEMRIGNSGSGLEN